MILSKKIDAEGRKLGFEVGNSDKENIHFKPLHFDL
jgi:hypothetical protein